MPEQYSGLISFFPFAIFMEQLMSLGVVPGDPDSVAKAFADLKAELVKEKVSWRKLKLKLKDSPVQLKI
jgi:hypothetical protein